MTLPGSDISPKGTLHTVVTGEGRSRDVAELPVLTAPLSQQLCEQLRLILEPTQAAVEVSLLHWRRHGTLRRRQRALLLR